MQSVLTIRIDSDIEELLEKVSNGTGRSRSEIVRDALRRQLTVSDFQQLRKKSLPYAEARGFLTDEDVFAKVS